MLQDEVNEFLEELRFAGFDMSTGVAVEQYLKFPVASMAQGAAGDLRSEGFDVDVEPDEDGGWVAFVTRTTEAVVPAVLRAQERAAATAEAHGGAYEGWNLVPPEQGDEPDLSEIPELPD